MGKLGSDELLAPIYGKIADNNYSGCYGEADRYPSYLLECNGVKGCSGSPIFLTGTTYKEPYKLIGMFNFILVKHPAHTIGLNGFVLSNVINVIIYRYFKFKASLDVIALNNLIKNGFPSAWLGADVEYWSSSSQSKYKQLVNLPYTGGVLLTNFIIGYDFKTNRKVYSPKFLNRHEVFQIKGPLLKTSLYKRFLDIGNVPIVLVSIAYFDSCYSSNVKRYVGKYSSQEAISYFYFGFETIAAYAIDSKYSNPVRYEFPQVTLEYYYYNGADWVLTSEVVGGNDLTNDYVTYSDINGNLFFQHKFEYPYTLIDYVETYMDHILDNSSFLGQGTGPYGQGPGSGPYGQGTGPYGQGTGPYGQGSGPYGQGSGPYGQGTGPYGQGSGPYGQGSGPYGQGSGSN